MRLQDVAADREVQGKVGLHVGERDAGDQHVTTDILPPARRDVLGVPLRRPVLARGIAYMHPGEQGLSCVGVSQLNIDTVQRWVLPSSGLLLLPPQLQG